MIYIMLMILWSCSQIGFRTVPVDSDMCMMLSVAGSTLWKRLAPLLIEMVLSRDGTFLCFLQRCLPLLTSNRVESGGETYGDRSDALPPSCRLQQVPAAACGKAKLDGSAPPTSGLAGPAPPTSSIALHHFGLIQDETCFIYETCEL